MRDTQMGEYISRLASENDVYAGEFLEALISARKTGKFSCGNLSIECRSKTKTKNIFLIMKGSEFVAQFPVPTGFLLNAGDSFTNFVKYPERTRRSRVKETEPSQSCCIRDVRAGMKHINLKAKVLEVTTPRQVHTRYGTIAVLIKALIGDATGKIQICLWNGQTENVFVGETIMIENAKASRFRGITQLSLMPNVGRLCQVSSLPMVLLSPSELQAE